MNESNTKASIKTNIGKPDKNGRRHISVEYKINYLADETKEHFEERYDYIKTKALRELS